MKLRPALQATAIMLALAGYGAFMMGIAYFLQWLTTVTSRLQVEIGLGALALGIIWGMIYAFCKEYE